MINKKNLSTECIFDGKITDIQNITYNIIERGFLYGDGFFDTIRYANGKMLFLENHVKRIQLGYEHFGFAFQQIDFKLISEWLMNYKVENARIRISVVRAAGGFYAPETNQAHYMVQAYQLNKWAYESNELAHFKIVKTAQKPQILPFKPLGSALKVMETLTVLNPLKTHIPLLVSANNVVLELGWENIFLIKENCIYTPSIDNNIFPGILRSYFIAFIQENMPSIAFEEKKIQVDDLAKFPLIIGTNVIKGLTPYTKSDTSCKMYIDINNAFNSYLKNKAIL